MHPILIQIGDFAIYTYGVTMALAFMIAFGWVFWRAKKRGENLDHYYNICLIGLVGGIVGARLLYVVVTWEAFADNPWSMFNLRSGGMVWYGGMVTVILLLIGYTRWKDMDFYRVTDLVAAPMILGLGIGRLGCLMSGCCYGRVCSLPWAIRYPENEHVSPMLWGKTVHPSPIYEMLVCFAIAGFLVYLEKRKPRKGQLTWAALLLYATVRFILEIWRGDEVRGYVVDNVLSVSQAVSLPIIVLAVIMLIRLRKNNGV